ncbi:gastrula zinc finger protein XlCGF26.1-like isoform X2 [Xenopus tropicalis]|uniref:Gastrula zinc finger protein XlCGF26.1-like isoform X2 n=1 Tax=Xenopus tropicalis TaxID=8364 RepID=A0A8J1JQR2_XENTR|nr:gastrula zinc finger protein XlCGF26.1-like isoform X2 [Xenopus tropicalis]
MDKRRLTSDTQDSRLLSFPVVRLERIKNDSGKYQPISEELQKMEQRKMSGLPQKNKEERRRLSAAGYRLVPYGSGITEMNRERREGLGARKQTGSDTNRKSSTCNGFLARSAHSNQPLVLQKPLAREMNSAPKAQQNQMPQLCTVTGGKLIVTPKLTKHTQPDAEENLHGSQKKRTDISGKYLKPGKAQSTKQTVFPKPFGVINPFVCVKSKRRFGSNGNLLIHQRIHTERPFSCTDCGKCFSHRTILREHRRAHMGKGPFPHSTGGNKIPSGKGNFQRHQGASAKGKPLTCTECGKSFKCKSDLRVHERTHTGEKPYVCTQCGKGFSQKANLNTHSVIHSTERPFSCTECGKCFRLKQCLKSHEKIHTGVKDFVCTECGKSFNRKFELQKHERTHTGEKPYVCTQCGKGFSQKVHLESHSLIHSTEKPFSCAECGKCFRLKQHLKSHEKTHTGVKDFVCTECGKQFIQKYSLRQHLLIHTGEKPFVCNVCGKGHRCKKHLERLSRGRKQSTFYMYQTKISYYR